jgi:GTP-binding protein Era
LAHKSGFVSIIGKPNVGKSTLMNELLGERLSIVTHKAQTTRHRIKGILNDENSQIVFSDTPGILEPHYLLHEKMMDFVHSSIADADIVLFITDLEEAYFDETVTTVLAMVKVPVVIVLNKTDLSTTNEINKLVVGWKKAIKPYAVIPASALNKFNIDKIKETLLELLPEAPPYFDKENISDASQRFFVSEIIREKIFLYYEKEIPYCSEVVIDTFKDEKTIVKISALIFVERDSQKPILIGYKGESLKRVGTDARKDMEKFLGKKVFLELFVKVDKDWRKKESQLRHFGYHG